MYVWCCLPGQCTHISTSKSIQGKTCYWISWTKHCREHVSSGGDLKVDDKLKGHHHHAIDTLAMTQGGASHQILEGGQIRKKSYHSNSLSCESLCAEVPRHHQENYCKHWLSVVIALAFVALKIGKLRALWWTISWKGYHHAIDTPAMLCFTQRGCKSNQIWGADT